MYVLYISVFYISNRNKRFWPMNLSEISDRWTRQNFLTVISVKTFRPLFPSIFSDRNTRQTFPTAIMVRSFWRIFLTEVPSEISDRNNSSVFGQPFLTVSDRKKISDHIDLTVRSVGNPSKQAISDRFPTDMTVRNYSFSCSAGLFG